MVASEQEQKWIDAARQGVKDLLQRWAGDAPAFRYMRNEPNEGSTLRTVVERGRGTFFGNKVIRLTHS